MHTSDKRLKTGSISCMLIFPNFLKVLIIILWRETVPLVACVCTVEIQEVTFTLLHKKSQLQKNELYIVLKQ